MKNKEAFTLVELIVVITILAILGTIAFISLQGYSSDARNATRGADTKSMQKTLELFILKESEYPTPDSSFEVTYDTDLLRNQGVFGKTVGKELGKLLSEVPIDPLTGENYIYSRANNKKEFEILTIYEGNYLAQNKELLNQTNANNNYTVKVSGNYNRIFIKTSKYIIPTPSIINSEIISNGDLTSDNIKSQVVNGQDNLLNFGTSEQKIRKITTLGFNPVNISAGSLEENKEAILNALSGAYLNTSLSGIEEIDYIKNVLTSGNNLKDNMFNFVILNKSSSTGKNVVIDNSEVLTFSGCVAETFLGKLDTEEIDGKIFYLIGDNDGNSLNAKAQLLCLSQVQNPELLSSNYKLTADITFDGENENWGNVSGWMPLGNSSSTDNKYKGFFQGNKHKIKNLYINRSGSHRQGLFGTIDTDSRIENIGLENLYINALQGDVIGGIAGSSFGTIENSYVKGEVKGDGFHLGGIAGWTNGSISNSYSSVNVYGGSKVGGLIGTLGGGTVNNSYSIGNISGVDSRKGGLIGVYDQGSVNFSYSLNSSYTAIGGRSPSITNYCSLYDSGCNPITINSNWDSLIWNLLGVDQQPTF